MLRRAPILSAYQRLLSTGRLKPDVEQEALTASLADLQNTLANKQQEHSTDGIYIYGGVGTGKSRIADLFAATLPSNVASRRTHFFEFMTDVHTRLHEARSLATYAGDPLVNIGRDVQHESPVLCLDEFQVSDIADAMILKRLFGSFWDAGGVLISTSNRHPTELYKNGLNRGLFLPFIAELQRRCKVFQMHGQTDYRTSSDEALTRDDAFFTDTAAFQTSLSEATHGQPFTELDIPVIMNRKLRISACFPSKEARPIVSATFSSLCEAFLGSTDYHALCRFTPTVYLNGLRQFAADELDIVRRFITLVDIAYEAKTRLVCLSTHPVLQTFKNIVLTQNKYESVPEPIARLQDIMVKGEGGSSSSHATTFINEIEWSATGRKEASLATGGAGETDVRFAILRAISRLNEMSLASYGMALD